jgi:hypothetical protein
VGDVTLRLSNAFVCPCRFLVWDQGISVTATLPSPGPTSRFAANDAVADSNAATDPFAEADEDSGQTTQTQEYIHIRIQRTFPRYPAVA